MERNALRDEAGPAAFLAAAYLACSIVFGGGGSPAPLPELGLQLLAACIAAAWLLGSGQGWRRVPAAAWWIAGLAVLVPLLQLVPLPPALWQALPGRESERYALELVDAADSWRALTLSPPRTLASLLAALAALLALLLAASLTPRSRQRLLLVIAAGGVATLVVGAGQLSGGSGNPLRFFDPEEPFLTGFQANHNSTADVILIAMLALAACARHWLDRSGTRLQPWQFVAAVVLADGVMALGLFLSGSRAGMALFPLVLLFQFLILQPGARIAWSKLALSALAAAALVGIAFVTLRTNREVAGVLARFSFEGEFRPELWRDSLFALGQYWPAGAGLGTFVPVMMAVERLEVVDPTLPNRAHNDYLEFAIGGGLPGLIVLSAIGLLLGRAIWQALRRPANGSRGQVLFAVGTLLVIGLHSLVDYPLRSMALAAVAATAAGLLLPARSIEPANLEGSQA